jgi:hypothetical protein
VTSGGKLFVAGDPIAHGRADTVIFGHIAGFAARLERNTSQNSSL